MMLKPSSVKQIHVKALLCQVLEIRQTGRLSLEFNGTVKYSRFRLGFHGSSDYKTVKDLWGFVKVVRRRHV